MGSASSTSYKDKNIEKPGETPDKLEKAISIPRNCINVNIDKGIIDEIGPPTPSLTLSTNSTSSHQFSFRSSLDLFSPSGNNKSKSNSISKTKSLDRINDNKKEKELFILKEEELLDDYFIEKDLSTNNYYYNYLSTNPSNNKSINDNSDQQIELELTSDKSKYFIIKTESYDQLASNNDGKRIRGSSYDSITSTDENSKTIDRSSDITIRSNDSNPIQSIRSSNSNSNVVIDLLECDHPIDLFTCELCQISFINQLLLDNHIEYSKQHWIKVKETSY